ncbi:phosphatase PAP2 family protein [Streptomyces sp. NPDC012765]|uniref:phosphatase PAP2 family protein n=1 Tax=Streptomyces sp. NPDC012765 TaxID=3155249 RepID=UPI0033C7411F
MKTQGARPSSRGNGPGHVPQAVASIAFAVLAMALLARHLQPLPGDTLLARLAVEHRPHFVVVVVQVITATGTGAIPYVLAAVAGFLLGAQANSLPRRQAVFRTAAAVAVCAGWLALGQALRFGIMTAIARPRPPESDWITHASRYSFPSGHATTSAMAAGIVIVALATRRPVGHRLWIALVTCWAVSIGASRIYLGVHWATDVIAGWLLALAWTLLGATVSAKTRTGSPGS